MCRWMKRLVWLAMAWLALAPAAAAQVAQGSITGTLRDATGAVLPGVTVEASSPALIRKSGDGRNRYGTGQYRFVDLHRHVPPSRSR